MPMCLAVLYHNVLSIVGDDEELRKESLVLFKDHLLFHRLTPDGKQVWVFKDDSSLILSNDIYQIGEDPGQFVHILYRLYGGNVDHLVQELVNSKAQ